ncbi:carbohydrate esterase family 16 protein [Parathielavia appendiculata]|uniref:Carbohydrate esterase family 16 protein n=1 Tax=Parathielavia appendiculata TaxID=2587402 RepID=A0AAN6TTY8_9PEZI|nr:carbohydrate esterase family 16 protein [Parathielavia appendiculata]
MGRFLTSTALAALVAFPGLIPGVHAQNEAALWSQCGGLNWTGPTNCVSGAVCTKWNDWFSQCVPGATTSSTSSARSTSTSTSISKTSSSSTSKATTSSTSTRTTLTTSTRTTSTTSSASSSSTVDPCALKYLISFGDSYSQTGFDINGNKPSSSNPLGNPPLPGWTASGGLNWVGFLASQYNTSTLLAYNFAYGGATTNATIVPPYAPTVLSFIDQVAQFSGSIASKPSYAPWGDNALFGVWIGVNDVGNTWWKSDYDQIVAQIMDSYFGQLQILYNAGARNFVLLTVPPIHRTPAFIAQGNQQAVAAAIAKYNAALSTRLAAFTTKNSGTTSKIVDTTVPFNTALDNPTAYGAPDATCYNEDGKSCLWFNDYHPGIEINRLVAKAVADAWKDSYF